MPEPTPRTRPLDFPTVPTDLLGQNIKAHVPGDLDPDPSLSDSSSKKSNFSNDINSSKSIKKKRDHKKNIRKHKKQDASDSSSRDSDSSDYSDYRCKQRKKKSHWKNDSIKLCARLTEKFLTKAYKLKIIWFKLDEDTLQRRIYFLTFVESLDMIFFQYKETFELLLDYPKIGEEKIKAFSKKAIRNILNTNIDVHSRRLFPEFPEYGIKCNEKLQSHYANMTFSEKVGMIEFVSK